MVKFYVDMIKAKVLSINNVPLSLRIKVEEHTGN